MFDAPFIIKRIPDISTIYSINESQEADLDGAVSQLLNDLFLDDMGLDHVKRWESILNIVPYSTDTLDDRRFRVKSKLMERLPYTIRTLKRKLDNLCPDGYEIRLEDHRTTLYVKLTLESENRVKDVQELLDRTLPLTVFFATEVVIKTTGHIYHGMAVSTNEHYIINKPDPMIYQINKTIYTGGVVQVNEHVITKEETNGSV